MSHHKGLSISSHIALIYRSPSFSCTLMERQAVTHLRLTQRALQQILQCIVSNFLFYRIASSTSLPTTFSFRFLARKACNQVAHG